MAEVNNNLSVISTYEDLTPGPDNLTAFIPFACLQLVTPFTVRFKSRIKEEYVSKVEEKAKRLKKSAVTLTHNQKASDSIDDDLDAMATDDSAEEFEIIMTATYDINNHLIELELKRCKETPCLLMKVIGLCMPFCSYLTLLTLRSCGLNGKVIYEISNFLSQSHITDICLDDSPITPEQRCYYKLLEHPSKLTSLSLARCKLTDDDCASLVSQIMYPMPSSKSLRMLDLTSNFISDIGARSISICLRSNRALQYLNLAGNQISDDGAEEIIKNLVEFPLTMEEILEKKQSYFEFLKSRQDVSDKLVVEEKALDDTSRSTKRRGGETPRSKQNGPPVLQLPPKSNRRSIRPENTFVAKEDNLAETSVCAYNHPFRSSETFLRDGYRYCIGNMSLCYLNLAYNNLSYISLKKLIEVVKYQGTALKNYGTGLLEVLIPGNNLPNSHEVYMLQEYLEHAMTLRSTQTQTRNRLKSKK